MAVPGFPIQHGDLLGQLEHGAGRPPSAYDSSGFTPVTAAPCGILPKPAPTLALSALQTALISPGPT